MRTQYFQNISPGHNNAVKRINSKGEIQYAIRDTGRAEEMRWGASAYTKEHLNDRTQFKRVTRDEARKLRPAAFRPVKKDKTAAPAPTPTKPGLAMANQYRKAVEGMDIKHSQKIAGIKAIRCLGDMGLAESLTVIENFDKFLAFVEENNVLPIVGSRFDVNPFTKRG